MRTRPTTTPRSTTRTTRTGRRARGAAAALGAVTAAGLLAGVPASGPAAAAPSSAAPVEGTKRVVVLEVDGCEGCTVQLAHGTERGPWVSREKQVADGVVRYVVPAEHAGGLSASLEAPWEGHLGYLTHVAFRYGGEQAGDAIGVPRARTKKRAEVCLVADTGARVTRVPVTVRQVRTPGQFGMVDGTLAFASVAQPGTGGLRPVVKGVAGGQEPPICG